MLLPSQSGSSDQPLDLGGFVVGLVAFCGGDSADNCTGDGGVVAFRILFKGLPVNGKEPAHLSSSLWAKPLGLLSVRESRNVSFSLLNNNQMQHFDIRTNNATSHTLLLLVTFSLGLEAFVAGLHEEFDSLVGKDTLNHGEALVVLTTRNLKLVSSELLTDLITVNLLAHPLVIKECPIIRYHCTTLRPYHFFSSLISIFTAVPLSGYEMLN